MIQQLLPRFQKVGVPGIPLSDVQKVAIRSFNEGAYEYMGNPCVCGSTKPFKLTASDRYGLSVDTHLCFNCGVIRTSPCLTEESLSRFYKTDYLGIYETTDVSIDKRFAEQKVCGEKRLDFMKDYLPATPIVFDVGCHTGGVLMAFKNAGARCYGCDLTSSGFQPGQDAGLTLIEGDESSLRQYGPADLIILSHVLEHLPHPRKTLASMYSLLKVSGLLYIELPGVFEFHLRDIGMMRFLQNAHLFHFTRGTLRNTLAGSGFAFVKGDQCIHTLFRRQEPPRTNSYYYIPGSTGLKRVRVYPPLILAYIILVEQMYRSGLLTWYQKLRKVARRGVRHGIADLYRWIRK